MNRYLKFKDHFRGYRLARFVAALSAATLVLESGTQQAAAQQSASGTITGRVLNAENGKDGLEALKNNPGIDVVLMDIMMPELDGYDTIRIIRRLEEFKNLPIIAVTAKAMKGDREKCIEAGASDYISKPVNIEQLLSLLRVGLAK